MNARVRQRPIAIGPLRAFEAVARRLSFRGAAEELHLTQSAVSRQIQALEADVGATLFLRGTRRVELTREGLALLRAVMPSIDRLDSAVRQIRQARGRRLVTVTTFASFASLWLIPRLPAFEARFPDIDIRLDTSDRLLELGSSEVDVALRYTPIERVPDGAQRLFGEVVAPATSPALLQHTRQRGRPLRRPADLTHQTLLEEEGSTPGPAYVTWRVWLAAQGLADLEPQRWLSFNYTHQQVQAAVMGQGLTMMRLALTHDALQRGDLVEPFPDGRMVSPYAYWLVTAPREHQPLRPEVEHFCQWILEAAAATREAIGDDGVTPSAVPVRQPAREPVALDVQAPVPVPAPVTKADGRPAADVGLSPRPRRAR